MLKIPTLHKMDFHQTEQIYANNAANIHQYLCTYIKFINQFCISACSPFRTNPDTLYLCLLRVKFIELPRITLSLLADDVIPK